MRFFFIMLFIGIAMFSFAQCNMHMPTRNTLPKRVLHIVNKTDSVVVYQVDAMNAPSDSSEIICGYTVIDKSKSISKHNIANLQEIVESLATVRTQRYIKKLSTFIPDYGFMFCADKSAIFLLLDQHADLCTFYYKKKQFLLDTDSVRNALETLLNNVWKRKSTKKEEAENSMPQGHSLGTNATTAFLNLSNIGNDSISESSQYIKLSPNILEMINSAKSVFCCIIDPLTKGDKDMERLGKYVVLQKKEITAPKQTKAVSDLIAGEKSFEKLDYIKNCTFLPDIALQINSGKKVLNILFSFYCSECMMLLDGKLVFRNDCSLIQSEIINLAKLIYPKDKYLRTISK
ncbi:hypothetical protein [uncultured Bacteroides sp.]|uniref:hypothetical protein n=1 Tax=uncultured Bacteroides sp. TaxID=162156 RepID=UPI00258888D0|nr:hypothetical protein [uncultured Bacteroides sp.]